MVRTSPKTGYYIDVFRSKSKLPHEYHDYLYHNIGDRLSFQNEDMAFRPTPDCYMKNGHDPWVQNRTYRNPGWHYFQDVCTAENYTKSVKTRFAVEHLPGGTIYMQLFIPGGEQRDYTCVKAPHTFQAPEPYDELPTPTLVIRKRGEAWEDPFVVVYEPFNSKEKGPSIESVEKLTQDGKYKGLSIRSRIWGESMIQYVITQSKGETFLDDQRKIEFTGSFAVITVSATGRLHSLYIGEGRNSNLTKHCFAGTLGIAPTRHTTERAVNQ